MKLFEIHLRFFDLVEQITALFQKYEVDFNEEELYSKLRKNHKEIGDGIRAVIDSVRGKHKEVLDDIVGDGYFDIDSLSIESIFRLMLFVEADEDIGLVRHLLLPFAHDSARMRMLPDTLQRWFNGQKLAWIPVDSDETKLHSVKEKVLINEFGNLPNSINLWSIDRLRFIEVNDSGVISFYAAPSKDFEKIIPKLVKSEYVEEVFQRVRERKTYF